MLGADAREFNRGWFDREAGYAPLTEAEAAASSRNAVGLFRMIQRSPVASIGVFGEKWGGGAEFTYFLVLLIVVAVIVVNRRLEDSHIGRAWEAIREDDVAAQADAERDEDAVADAAPEPSASQAETAMRNWTRGGTPWGGRRPGPPLRTWLRWRILRLLGSASFVPVITHPVEHGDVLTLAGREWFVVHTPGHTADHFCLHDPADGIFLAGDHVLPTITPHISGISSSPDPLSSFFYSLDRVAEIHGVEQVLPAHGHPFDDLAARTEAIKRHHHERLEKVKEISRAFGRPASVEEFSRRLFAPRSWGSMAESETYAHLEHLRIAGEAERSENARGSLLYLTR